MLQKILKYSPFKLPIYHNFMQTTSATKTYDLKIRTAQFAKDVRALVRSIPINITNYDDIKQVLRSSGSIGANYREADEGVSKRDFANRIKICRKESKETCYWLELIADGLSDPLKARCLALAKEGNEFVLIFNAIVRKTGFEHLAKK